EAVSGVFSVIIHAETGALGAHFLRGVGREPVHLNAADRETGRWVELGIDPQNVADEIGIPTVIGAGIEIEFLPVCSAIADLHGLHLFWPQAIHMEPIK